MSRVLPILAVLMLTALVQTASATEAEADLTGGRGPQEPSAFCPDAKIWTKIIDQVCWSCMLPIRLMGFPMGAAPSGFGDVAGTLGYAKSVSDTSLIDTPDGASSKVACMCSDNNGVPQFGLPMGLWMPARLVEVTRVPYCSPSLGGIRLKSSARLLGGQRSNAGDTDGTFMNYHYFYFPLMSMLNLFLVPECRGDGFSDFDLGYLSELDPSWNDDELSFYLAPESAIFANPIAMSACVADAVMSTAGRPIESMYWCAGTWGNMYPLTGNVGADASPVRTASLITTRALAALHRRGLARKTMGDDALCGSSLHPMIPKSQYRFSQLFSMAEADGSCCHNIGASTFTWGEWRTKPGNGEDFVNLVWRYTDCCVR